MKICKHYTNSQRISQHYDFAATAQIEPGQPNLNFLQHTQLDTQTISIGLL
jgi:hypothetical protein